MATLFEKYGGFGRINHIVIDFYDTLLDSDELGPYFDNVEMAALIDHQTKFVSYLLGGPASFSNGHLKNVHRHLNITPDHFELMKATLSATLLKHGFESVDVATVEGEIEARREFIVG